MQKINFGFASTALFFEAIFVVEIRFKNFLGPTYVNNQLWFWKYSPIFLFLNWPHFGPLLHIFRPFGAILLALWGYLCASKHIFRAYWCRLSIFVLEVQPYFLFLIWPHLEPLTYFRPFGAILWFFGAILWVRIRLKNYCWNLPV